MLCVFFTNVYDVNTDRDTLLYLYKISCRVVGRYQRVFGAGCFGNSGNFSVKDFSGQGIYLDADRLSDVDIYDLRFLVVGGNPFVFATDQVGNGLTGLYKLLT